MDNLKYKKPKVEKHEGVLWPEWENIVLHHDKCVPFEIEKFDDSKMDINEFRKKIPGQTKENPVIWNIKDMQEDPLYPGLKEHIGETINVENMFYNVKWIKIVEE